MTIKGNFEDRFLIHQYKVLFRVYQKCEVHNGGDSENFQLVCNQSPGEFVEGMTNFVQHPVICELHSRELMADTRTKMIKKLDFY